jgi:peptidoglycan/LPS O-acetylase OafA/YrhL
LLVAFRPGGRIRLYNRVGDYSYGIYIYAFPMQQLAVHSWPGITPLQDIGIAFPATLLFALLSWHLLERRALAQRNRVAELLAVRWVREAPTSRA